MKAIFTVWLLLSISCSGADTNIVNKVIERDRNGDGAVDICIETSSRGQVKVMQTVSLKKPSGNWSKSRYFYAGEAVVMTESDEDGDGVFEFFVLHNAANKEPEIFSRLGDGTIKPVNQEEIEKYKRSATVFENFWKEAYSSTNAENFKILIKETQRKLKESDK